jgi:hypothetical protein
MEFMKIQGWPWPLLACEKLCHCVMVLDVWSVFIQLSVQLQITIVLENLRVVVPLFHKFDFLRYISALIFVCIRRSYITLWK